ncbi:MAG: hypothetical protein EFT35_07755 [Methanophagales archaeon ANME-1-THS]|nr:MAG: hypothetical protein EFT35_07755 [Methanophagales archaeon ANME-1-THS]
MTKTGYDFISHAPLLSQIQIDSDFNTSHDILTRGHIGVNTSNPLRALHINTSDNQLRLGGTNSSNAFLDLRTYSGVGGGVVTDISPIPPNPGELSYVRFFRATNTSGPKAIQFLRGNDTTSVSCEIRVGGTSYVRADNFQGSINASYLGGTLLSTQLPVQTIFSIDSTNNWLVINKTSEDVLVGDPTEYSCNTYYGCTLHNWGTLDSLWSYEWKSRACALEISIVSDVRVSDTSKTGIKFYLADSEVWDVTPSSSGTYETKNLSYTIFSIPNLSGSVRANVYQKGGETGDGWIKNTTIKIRKFGTKYIVW